MSDNRRIDFLVIGAQKAGTTTIDGYLRQHPGVEMAAVKEVHFFSRDHAIPQGRLTLGGPPFLKDMVAAAFDDASASQSLYTQYHSNWSWSVHTVRGEVTPDYVYWPPTLARARQYSHRLQIICCLRNPYDRAWSHWRMNHGNGTETLDFTDAIEAELSEAAPGTKTTRSYVGRGRYGTQIERVLAMFPRHQCLFIRFEDLIDQSSGSIRSLCDFLGIDQLAMPPGLRLKAGSERGRMPDRAMPLLQPEFEPEIRRLEAALGWSCPNWFKPTGTAGQTSVLTLARDRIRRAREGFGRACRHVFGPPDPDARLNRWQV